MIKDVCKKCLLDTDFTCYLSEINTITILMGCVLVVGSVISYLP